MQHPYPHISALRQAENACGSAARTDLCEEVSAPCTLSRPKNETCFLAKKSLNSIGIGSLNYLFDCNGEMRHRSSALPVIKPRTALDKAVSSRFRSSLTSK